MGGSKFGKLAKVATKADNLFDVVKGSKIVTRANKAIDGTKTFIKSNVGKLLDTPIWFLSATRWSWWYDHERRWNHFE